MNKVTLIFPNTIHLADFILNNNISKAEVNSREQTMTAFLTDDEIMRACGDYHAEIQDRIHFNAL